jgi:hypothetical protein
LLVFRLRTFAFVLKIKPDLWNTSMTMACSPRDHQSTTEDTQGVSVGLIKTLVPPRDLGQTRKPQAVSAKSFMIIISTTIISMERMKQKQRVQCEWI